MPKRKLHIITHGCQMNQYDSRRMRERLADGWTDAATAEDADCIIINTCSVREKPQKKVLSELSRLKPLKKDRPDLILAVAGCVAQQEKEHLLDLVPYLDLVVGPDRLSELPELIARVQSGERIVRTGFEPDGFTLDTLAPHPSLGSKRPGQRLRRRTKRMRPLLHVLHRSPRARAARKAVPSTK